MSLNLAVILRMSAQSSPDRPVAVYDGGRVTYRELDRASDRLAAALTAAGIKPGDPVALQLPNIPQFLSYFGILKSCRCSHVFGPRAVRGGLAGRAC